MASIARKTLMTILAFFIGAFLVIIILVWVLQERIAFQPPRGPYPEAGYVRRVDYTASDGQPLFAYVVGDPSTSPGLLLVFHGNADLAVRMVEWAEEVAERTGVAVMLAEYRGYMGLSGRPSYEGVGRDAEAAYAYATSNLHVDPSRVAYYGHSLGTAVASELAARHRPQVLILEAPFTSARDIAGTMFGSWFTGTIWPIASRIHFNTAAIVQSLDVPVYVAHGEKDRVVPYRMGEEVYRKARMKGKWLFIPEAYHSDVRIRGGERYWEWIAEALEPVSSRK